MPERRWGEWPKKTMQELNSMSGFLGIGGIVLGGIGAVSSVPIILGVGFIIATSAILFSGVRAYPKRLKEPDEVIGEIISIAELEDLAGDIPRIGIVGPSKTGKSTLVEKLKRDTNPPDATSSVYAVVLKSGGRFPKTFAMIDGAGEEFQQQFAVAAESDGLFLILDHNQNKDDATIVMQRKQEHERFIGQIIPFLRSHKSRVSRVYIYLNKHDNWLRSKNAEEFETWGNELKNLFSDFVTTDLIITRSHSNWRTDDINMFWNEVGEITK